MTFNLRISHTAVALLALLACSATSIAQQPGAAATPAPGSDGVFTLHASTHLVVLDSRVVDWKGSPATGLKKEDFHLLEDNHEQTLKTLEEHAPIDPAVARERLAAVAAKLPPNTFTNFKPFPSGTVNVIVMDALTSGPSDMKIFQRLLDDYMKTVPAGTPFIVFRLDTQLHMVQGLTMDPAVLRAAVQMKPSDMAVLPQTNYMQDRQIVGTAVDQLNRYLAAIPGRKTLLWFTALIGIHLSSTGDHNDQVEADLFCKWTDSFQQNRIDVYRYSSDPERAQSGLGCQAGLGAGNTIAAVVDSAAHFYTLSYTPTNAVWDGKYRKLKVSVNAKGTPWKDIKLDYRQGYFGRESDGSVRSSVVAPSATPNAESLALRQAMGMGTPEPDEVVFEATVKPDAEIAKDVAGGAAPQGNFLSEAMRTQGYRGYAVHYAVRADQLGLIAAPDGKAYAEKLEVVAVVYDSLGHAINSKRAAVSVSFDGPDDPRLQKATVTADVITQVPATGDYFLRFGVRDVAADHVGAVEVPVSRITLPGK